MRSYFLSIIWHHLRFYSEDIELVFGLYETYEDTAFSHAAWSNLVSPPTDIPNESAGLSLIWGCSAKHSSHALDRQKNLFGKWPLNTNTKDL